MNTNEQIGVPGGLRDLLFKDAAYRRVLESQLQRVFFRRGFEEIITPTLEFYEVFASGVGAVPQEQLYKLFDQKGRILALRHDMTTPIARVAASKLADAYMPLKLCYHQTVFRAHESLLGKRDELFQCGVELLGPKSPAADLEVLCTAIEALRDSEHEDFVLELGHVGFFEGAVAAAGCNKAQLDRLHHLLFHKNFTAYAEEIKALGEGGGSEALAALPQLFGAKEVLAEARTLCPGNARAKEALDYIEQLWGALAALGYERHLAIDLSLTQQMGYYTGLVFRGHLAGASEACLSGGRYDGLCGRFGQDVPAVGFAISVDSLVDAKARIGSDISTQMRLHLLLHPAEGATAAAEHFLQPLRAAGARCELSLCRSMEESRAYAARRGVQRFCRMETDGSVHELIEEGGQERWMPFE